MLAFFVGSVGCGNNELIKLNKDLKQHEQIEKDLLSESKILESKCNNSVQIAKEADKSNQGNIVELSKNAAEICQILQSNTEKRLKNAEKILQLHVAITAEESKGK